MEKKTITHNALSTNTISSKESLESKLKEEKIKHNKVISNLGKQIVELSKTNRGLNYTIYELENSINKLQEEYDVIKIKYDVLNINYKELEVDFSILQEDYNTIFKQELEYNKIISDLKEEITGLYAENRKLNHNIYNLNDTIDELKEERTNNILFSDLYKSDMLLKKGIANLSSTVDLDKIYTNEFIKIPYVYKDGDKILIDGECCVLYHIVHSWYAISINTGIRYFIGKCANINIGLVFKDIVSGLNDCRVEKFNGDIRIRKD